MKRRIIQFLLGFLYILLVALLLLIHVQRITGDIQRVMATVETLFLAAFTLGILGLYLKTLSGRGQPEKAKDKGKDKDEPKPEGFEAFLGLLEGLCGGKAATEALSRREAEVAWLLYRGYTNRQIGEELYIAETTVKKHATHIYEKLQVSGKKELKERILAEREDGS